MNNYLLEVYAHGDTMVSTYTFPSYDAVMWAFHAMVQGIEVTKLRVVLVSTGEVVYEQEFGNDCQS